MLRSVNVKGEVSNVTYNPSNHIYFTLKDKSGTLKCVMFAGKRAGLKFMLKEGQQIVVNGYISIYEKSGGYQLYASEIELDGAGNLYEELEKLKKHLEEKGMFAEEYKQKIPKFASKVGVVTAQTGAAIQDIINISKRRNPYVQLYLYPAQVQGEGASQQIANAIRALDRFGVDVIIVGRGGGSIEDLWAFNEEIVADAIFNCETPIISAVGHETDWTIADYVSDRRAPTPSAAAEIAVYSYDDFRKELFTYQSLLSQKMDNRVEYEKRKLDRARLIVEKMNPEMILDNKRMTYIHLEEQLRALMEKVLNERRHTYELLIEQMKGLSPLEKLSKGYAYAEHNEKPLKSVNDISCDDDLTLYLKDGKLKTKVISIINT